MNVEIGKKVSQSGGFSAFIPNPFPQKGLFHIPPHIQGKVSKAERLVGKLDGIILNLPDVDFFLDMFLRKDATASSQIEGTKATIIDALAKEAKVAHKATDADDILYYIKALNYGMKKLEELPLSLRFIQEIHKELMTGARATHFSDPGNFRKSQNYIGGTNPGNALFVPPPVFEMKQSLGDFEKFLHEEQMLPLLHIGLMHAQFETIHPFLDGNGRTGRLLITFLFCQKKLLEKPLLFLSSWFKKHQKVYYQKLNDYHNGQVESWILFFLEAVIETAQSSIDIAKKIRKLRDADMEKIQALGKRESESGINVLKHLFRSPIVNTNMIMLWTGFSRPGAKKIINRFVDMKILQEKFEKKAYIYKKYVDIFQDK